MRHVGYGHMIKTAIFDFDGTLADTIPLCLEAFRRAVNDLDGRVLTDREIERNFGPDDLGVIRKLFPGKPEWHEHGRELFIHYYQELHAEMGSRSVSRHGRIAPQSPQQRIRLAMVTGKRRESADISLKFFHLDGFFPVLETGSPEGGVKTDRINRARNAWELPHGKRFTLETPRRTWTHAVPYPSASLPRMGSRSRRQGTGRTPPRLAADAV